MSDKELQSAASYYMWLAENFPDLHRNRLDEITAEAVRRGKPEIVHQARAALRR
jgi:hypothetical protein